MRIEHVSFDTVMDAYNICVEECELSPLCGYMPLDPRRLAQSISIYATDTRYFVRLAYDDTGTCVGIIAGYVYQPEWSSVWVAAETMWYVREKVKDRGKGASMLMKAFVDWARNRMHVAAISVPVNAGIDDRAADVMVRRHGFKRQGTNYILSMEE